MKKMIVLGLVAFLFCTTLIARAETGNKYVELIHKQVQAFESPYGIPQIFETTIDVEGYSEIRIFIHVFAENYTYTPITSKTSIKATLYHCVSSGSWAYSEEVITSDVTSYINGWFSEKLIGDTLRIVAFAHDFPAGPYTVTVTYYLVR